MKSNNDEISFENEKEARILLEESRMRIDEIDNELCDLISERTSLAKSFLSNILACLFMMKVGKR